MQMDYTPLKDVNQQSHRWRVRVRTTRFTEYIDENKPDKVLRLDLVFLDEQSTTMDAQIPERHLPLFAPLLKENSVYYIEYFEVADARSSYQPVDNPIMARFTPRTKITKVSLVPQGFPLYACDPVPFEILRTRVNDRVLLSDVFGLITAISHIKNVNVKGTPKPIRNIQITDGRENAEITLWGPHAMQFEADTIQDQSQQEPIILLLVGVITKLYNGQLSIQGTTVCKWYTNPALPNVITLQNRLAGISYGIKWIGQPIVQEKSIPATVQQISNLNPHDVLGNSYTIRIAIKELTPGQPWWYLACAICKRTVSSEHNSYKCSKCGTTTADPRYRVTVNGVDPENIHKENAEIAEFIFFAETAQQLIGCPVLPLITAAKGIEDFIPPQITRLYGRQYDLKVSVTHRALQRVKISYQVNSFVPFLCPTESASGNTNIQGKPETLSFHESAMLKSTTSGQTASPVATPSTPTAFIDIVPEIPQAKKNPVATPSTPAAFIDIVPEIPQAKKILPETDSTLKQPLSTTHHDVPIPEGGTSTASKRGSVKRKLRLDKDTSSD